MSAEADSGAESQAITQPQTPETDGKEENFFDPKSVPQELLPAYKQMQAAFTKKTQEIAAARKEAESIKGKYSKYDQYIPVLEEMLTPRQTAQVNPEMAALERQLKDAGYSPEAIEMMKIGAGFMMNHFNQTISSRDQQEHLSAQIDQAEALDPRLNDESLVYDVNGERTTFGEIVANIVRGNPSWANDPVGATKKAIAIVDGMINSAKTAGKQELSDSAKGKARQFSQVTSSPQGASSNSHPKTVREAAEEAAKELGMPLR